MAGLLRVCGICCFCGLLGWVAAQPYCYLDNSLPLWFVLAPLLRLTAFAPSRRRAALYAFSFGIVWTNVAFSFLWRNAFEGAIALSIYTALIYTAAFLAIRWVARRALGLDARSRTTPSVAAAIFATAALWALVEIGRSVVPILYFPWLLLGHALLFNAELRQAADLLGVYGLSFLIAGTNAWLAFGLPAFFPAHWKGALPPARLGSWRAAWVLAALTAGAYVYGAERVFKLAPRLQSGATIAVIQGNIKTKLGRTLQNLNDQMVRHVELHREVIEKATAAEGHPPALVCWAETMVPGNMNNDPWGEVFRAEVKKTGIPAMTGANYLEPDDFSKPFEQQRIHNSAFIFDGQGHELLRYYKRRLVAFGEYVPYAREYPCLAFIRSVTQDQYVPGEKPSTICEIGGYHAALTLCVEDIHPALAREAAFLGADTLFNLTNDGWFYQTHGPRAHLQAAAWRAIEVRRPLLRVTNTGRTVAVDPLGNIELIVPAETEAVGWTRLKRIDGGGAGIVTPYMLLGEFWTAAIFAGVLGLALWVVLRNPMRPSA